jgi:thioredoxin 1
VAFLDVTDATFDEVVRTSETAVVVHFTPPWCAPCTTVEAHLLQLAGDDGARVRLVRLDIDASLEVPSRYGVLSLPTVIVFHGSEERDRIVGAQPRRRYETALAPYRT